MRPLRIKTEQTGFLALGASSLLLVFVVLCLVCFSALSLVSANAEARLTARLGENVAAWYAADAQAQAQLAKLDALLDEGHSGEALQEALAAQGFAYEQREDGAYVTFYVTISAYTALETQVRLEEEETAYTLVKSASVLTEELVYTELPYIWNGVITDD